MKESWTLPALTLDHLFQLVTDSGYRRVARRERCKVAAATLTTGCMVGGEPQAGEGLEQDIGTTQQGVITTNGTTLNGTTLNGTTLNGTDFIGAELEALGSHNTKIYLQIEDIRQLVSGDDIYLYTVNWRECRRMDASGCIDFGDWSPICEGDNEAMPFIGRWNVTNPGGKDPGTDNDYITFACRGSAMATCTEELGYKPWTTNDRVASKFEYSPGRPGQRG